MSVSRFVLFTFAGLVSVLQGYDNALFRVTWQFLSIFFTIVQYLNYGYKQSNTISDILSGSFLNLNASCHNQHEIKLSRNAVWKKGHNIKLARQTFTKKTVLTPWMYNGYLTLTKWKMAYLLNINLSSDLTFDKAQSKWCKYMLLFTVNGKPKEYNRLNLLHK